MKPMPGNEACFIDTNVWLYAFIDDDAQKQDVAQKIIKSCEPVISAQVINEVCVNLIKRAKLSEERISELVETFYEKYEVVESGKELLLSASQLRQEYALSYWDSLIVAAALVSEVGILYSEDMQDGLAVRQRLKIVKSFKS